MIDEETTPEFQTESLISRYQNNTMNSAFMASPTEVIKIGEPLSNSNEIKQALKNGEIYKRGFEDARKRYERPNGAWLTIGEEQGALGIIYKRKKCSRCDWEHSLIIPDNFCPNCGADMRGERNEMDSMFDSFTG